MKTPPRPEHPRPEFERPAFHSLNGVWRFAFDREDAGLAEGWHQPGSRLQRDILVPFSYRSVKSGVAAPEACPVVWYRRGFALPRGMARRRIWLRFGAVREDCQVFVNGQLAGAHRGGCAPFGFDISPWLLPGENDLCLRVRDEGGPALSGCQAQEAGGIWQPVYLEATGPVCLDALWVKPGAMPAAALVDVQLDRVPARQLMLEYSLGCEGRLVAEGVQSVHGSRMRLLLDMRDETGQGLRLWDPEAPLMYDLRLRLRDADEEWDAVTTGIGMREAAVTEGRLCLNGRPLARPALFRPGWEETLGAPPDDDALREALQKALEKGAGALLLPAAADPRACHWCDRLGIPALAQLPGITHPGPEAVSRLTGAALELIRRDHGHPSLVAWVLPETDGGVSRLLEALCLAADGTRPVIRAGGI